MPKKTPTRMSPAALRAIGSQLAELAHRCNQMANEMDRVGIKRFNCTSYAAWGRAMKELGRFFKVLEPEAWAELEKRGAYKAAKPEKPNE